MVEKISVTEISLFYDIVIIRHLLVAECVCRSVTIFQMPQIRRKYICLTLLTRAKCGTRSTLCWKILNISDSTELFAL